MGGGRAPNRARTGKGADHWGQGERDRLAAVARRSRRQSLYITAVKLDGVVVGGEVRAGDRDRSTHGARGGAHSIDNRGPEVQREPRASIKVVAAVACRTIEVS